MFERKKILELSFKFILKAIFYVHIMLHVVCVINMKQMIYSYIRLLVCFFLAHLARSSPTFRSPCVVDLKFQ